MKNKNRPFVIPLKIACLVLNMEQKTFDLLRVYCMCMKMYALGGKKVTV